MKTSAPTFWLARRCFAAAAVLIFTTILGAQAVSTGTIEGRVFDSRRGEYLEKARITVDGSQQETLSAATGQYRLTGIPAGTVAAAKRGTMFDQTLMGLSVTGYSMPIFWWGLLLIMFVAERWGLTPVSGRIDLIKFYFEPVTGFMVVDAWLSGQAGAVKDALHHLVLPAIVLGTIPLAVIARMTRSAMLEVLSEDYVRTARAKGLPAWRVIGLHALRNALIPVVTIIGLQVGGLMAGAVLTETIFSWPGVGKWLIESISRRDYPALQGGVMLISSVVITVNLMVDLTYGLINPRIRHG